MSDVKTEAPVIKKATDARELSKWGQLVAALWIATLSGVKFFRMSAESIEMTDIILSGMAIFGCFAPTVVSIWLDKFVEMKKAGKL